MGATPGVLTGAGWTAEDAASVAATAAWTVDSISSPKPCWFETGSGLGIAVARGVPANVHDSETNATPSIISPEVLPKIFIESLFMYVDAV